VKLESLRQADTRLTAHLRIAEQPGLLRMLAALLAHSGDSWFWILGLSITYWFAEGAWKTWALRMLGMILALAVVVTILKFSIRRRRPEGEWGAIYRNTDPHSFPSGHAARAALLAVLAIGWGPAWLGVTLLIWAPLVSLARVAMGLHYISDVIAGVIVGVIGGFLGVFVLN
jgi:undecaprenyl-diphosphatase